MQAYRAIKRSHINTILHPAHSVRKRIQAEVCYRIIHVVVLRAFRVNDATG